MSFLTLFRAWCTCHGLSKPGAWVGKSEGLRVQHSETHSQHSINSGSGWHQCKSAPRSISCFTLILAQRFLSFHKGLELPYAIGKDTGGYKMLICRHPELMSELESPLVLLWR